MLQYLFNTRTICSCDRVFCTLFNVKIILIAAFGESDRVLKITHLVVCMIPPPKGLVTNQGKACTSFGV